MKNERMETGLEALAGRDGTSPPVQPDLFPETGAFDAFA
jgi:hypothetical protein